MGRTLTSTDIAMIVFGVIMFILTISLFGIVGTLSNASPITGILNSLQFGVAGWFLLTSILSIVSGATGNKCAYTSVIVLAIFGIFIALGAGVYASINSFTSLLSGLGTAIVRSSSRSSFDEADVYASILSLPYGIVAIDFLSFVFLIVVSCIACCGTCCNNSPQGVQGGQTTTIVYQGGPPPGYVGAPPHHGGHMLSSGQAYTNPSAPQSDVHMQPLGQQKY